MIAYDSQDVRCALRTIPLQSATVFASVYCVRVYDWWTAANTFCFFFLFLSMECLKQVQKHAKRIIMCRSWVFSDEIPSHSLRYRFGVQIETGCLHHYIFATKTCKIFFWICIVAARHQRFKSTAPRIIFFLCVLLGAFLLVGRFSLTH